MGWYDGFCNSYLSQEEEENASVKIAKWLIFVPDKCCPLAEVVCKSSDGREHSLTLTLPLHAVKFQNKECFLSFVENQGEKADH